MLIETEVVRSKSELLKEAQGLIVTKAVIFRNVDRKTWEQMMKDNQAARVVVAVDPCWSAPLSDDTSANRITILDGKSQPHRLKASYFNSLDLQEGQTPSHDVTDISSQMRNNSQTDKLTAT